ncbi:MAG: restriction endonuclease subunit S [Cypionkella sp.]
MVTAADVDGGRVNYDTARYTSREAFDKLLSPKSKPKKNDILLTKDGALGRVALVGDETICINQSVAILRPNNRIDPQYLSLLLQADPYQRRMIEDAGGSTIKHIYITIVNRMPIAVPQSKDEQRAIAEALADADGLITALEGMIAKKRDLKQAAMQHLLTGKTRLPGFSGEWEVKRLGDVAEIVMGQSPASANYNTAGQGLPLIQGNADIRDRKTIRRVFTTQVTKHGRAGDLLMSVRAPVGEVALATFDCCLGRGVCAIRYPNWFLYHALIAREPDWAKLSKGSTFDSVNSSEVRAFAMDWPSDPAEQSAIAEVLSDMDADLAALEAQAAKARAVKQGMMQELLTGRVRLV